MTACDYYRPIPEWNWPAGYTRMEDIPTQLRYSRCKCGAAWQEHLGGGMDSSGGQDRYDGSPRHPRSRLGTST